MVSPQLRLATALSLDKQSDYGDRNDADAGPSDCRVGVAAEKKIGDGHHHRREKHHVGNGRLTSGLDDLVILAVGTRTHRRGEDEPADGPTHVKESPRLIPTGHCHHREVTVADCETRERHRHQDENATQMRSGLAQRQEEDGDENNVAQGIDEAHDRGDIRGVALGNQLLEHKQIGGKPQGHDDEDPIENCAQAFQRSTRRERNKKKSHRFQRDGGDESDVCQ